MRRVIVCVFLFVIAFSASGQSKALKAKADKGNVEAMVEVAKIYEEKGGKRNIATAAKYFKKAAERGNAEAQYKLGEYYYYGRIEIELSAVKAMEWWEKAAKQEHAEALYRIGMIYMPHETGVVGYEKDEKKALEYLERAAALGHEEAQQEVDSVHWFEGWNGVLWIGVSLLPYLIIMLVLFFKHRSAFYAVIVSLLSFLIAAAVLVLVGLEGFYAMVKDFGNWIVGCVAIGVAFFSVWWISRIPVKPKYKTWKTLRLEGICILLLSGFASVEHGGNFDGLLEFFGIYPDAEGTVSVAFFVMSFFAVQGCLASFYRLQRRSDAWKYMFTNLLFLLSAFFIGFGLGSIVATFMLFVLVAGGVVGAGKEAFNSSTSEPEVARVEEEDYDYEVTDEKGFTRKLKDEGWGKLKDDQGKGWRFKDSFGAVERDE